MYETYNLSDIGTSISPIDNIEETWPIPFLSSNLRQRITCTYQQVCFRLSALASNVLGNNSQHVSTNSLFIDLKVIRDELFLYIIDLIYFHSENYVWHVRLIQSLFSSNNLLSGQIHHNHGQIYARESTKISNTTVETSQIRGAVEVWKGFKSTCS